MNLTQKIAQGVWDVFGGLLEPVLKMAVKQSVSYVLENAYQQLNKEEGDAVLTAVYPAVDVFLEEAAMKTDTGLDDAVVDGLKEAIEQVADNHDVNLPNLDGD